MLTISFDVGIFSSSSTFSYKSIYQSYVVQHNKPVLISTVFLDHGPNSYMNRWIQYPYLELLCGVVHNVRDA